MTTAPDRVPVRLEDGSVFEVQSIQPIGWVTQTAIVVPNQAILAKAVELLPIALAMADSREKRLSLLRKSGQSLDLEKSAFSAATDAAKTARDRADCLQLLASGHAVNESRFVTLGDWRELLEFFKQDLSTGSVNVIEGVAP